jgi:F-type H+-transporting ATPase subunit delta
MKGTRAALRYAKATLSFAQYNKAAEIVAKDMRQLEALLNENATLNSALENPLLPVEKKHAVVTALLPNACESTTKLFSLLGENNRLSLLPATCVQYLSLFAKAQGEQTAVVTSAVPLSPELEKRVLEKAKSVSNQKIQIENKVDPSLLGGFILKIGDMQYDASVAYQLKAIKTLVTKKNTI